MTTTRHDPYANAADAGPPRPADPRPSARPRDELQHAKALLLAVDESAPSLGESLSQTVRDATHRHPYAATALALAAGLIAGKGTLGGKARTLVGAWALKTAVTYLTRKR